MAWELKEKMKDETGKERRWITKRDLKAGLFLNQERTQDK